MQTIEALQGAARTYLVHNFGNGLDGENRFVVERFKALLDGDIRPVQPEASPDRGPGQAKGRRKAKRMVVSREEAEAMRPARTEIIICTGLRTRSGRQYWGTSRPRSSTTAVRGAEPPSPMDVPPARAGRASSIRSPISKEGRPWPMQIRKSAGPGTESAITGWLPNGAPPVFASSADIAHPRPGLRARREAGMCVRCGGRTSDGGSRCAPCSVLESEGRSAERKNEAARRRYRALTPAALRSSN